jgi:hypothetical protein
MESGAAGRLASGSNLGGRCRETEGLGSGSCGAARTAVLVGVVVVVVAAVAVLVPPALSRHDDRRSTRGDPPCANFGCGAVVNVVQRSPRVTVFFGQSCSGPSGNWFLNAVEGGAASVAHPAYYLRWSFPPNSDTATPSGKVTVSGGTEHKVVASLDHGRLSIAGVGRDRRPVGGTGSLEVRLTGVASAPNLVFVETGLSGVERELELISPFDVAGRPLTLSVAPATGRIAGC